MSPSPTVAAAPMNWARIRPTNAIHAARSLSFFFLAFRGSASAPCSCWAGSGVGTRQAIPAVIGATRVSSRQVGAARASGHPLRRQAWKR